MVKQKKKKNRPASIKLDSVLVFFCIIFSNVSLAREVNTTLIQVEIN